MNVVFVESTSVAGASNSSAERKAASYYLSCMNANKTMDHLGGKPLIDLLADEFGHRGGGAMLWSTAADLEETAWDFQGTLETVWDFQSRLETACLGLPGHAGDGLGLAAHA